MIKLFLVVKCVSLIRSISMKLWFKNNFISSWFCKPFAFHWAILRNLSILIYLINIASMFRIMLFCWSSWLNNSLNSSKTLLMWYLCLQTGLCYFGYICVTSCCCELTLCCMLLLYIFYILVFTGGVRCELFLNVLFPLIRLW